jgi:CRP-like cAMP-binding protein
MTKFSSVTYQNKLLAAMAADDLAFLSPQMERVDLDLHATLQTPRTPIPFVYFPEGGIISVIASLSPNRNIEVGVIGRDGTTGMPLVHYDDRSPFTYMVQIAGVGTRIPSDHFVAALERSATMRKLLIRYGRAFMIQLACTALSNGRSKLEERLARWILMVHDRIEGDKMRLTHDDLALMLGVRRPGVTVALHVLEGKGLIRSLRGEIIVKDRAGLIKRTLGAYRLAEAEYSRLVGSALEKD